MDILNKKLKDLNLYEVKAYVRKAQNVVYNFTEMESKVREATNNEPWGASSSLMQQIAAGTYNFREREEIIGMVFRRFTEKAANEWRQIYKALQLLEYLIKNGSERLVDDARANISVITMLRSFHYVDSKGQDQGINVRNRAKVLISLLNDESQIRSERKKARENAKKFGGVASADVGGAPSNRPRQRHTYDDDEYTTNRVYGDGGVYGERYEEHRTGGQKEFEEYDAGESSRSRANGTTSTSRVTASASKAPEVNLFSFDEAPAPKSTLEEDDDDDFDDFQSASPAPAPTGLNLNGLYQTAPTATNDFGDFGAFTATPTYANAAPAPLAAPQPFATPAKKDDAFSSLFSSAKTQSHAQAHVKPAQQPTPAASTFDDDFLGMGSVPAPAKSTQSTQSNPNDLDLLSF